jgi:hypothetical protein
MVSAVRGGLQRLGDGVDVLIVTPSGSMLDPREVPPAARRSIFALMAAVPGVSGVIVESRADTVDDEVLAELTAAFPGRAVVVQMGLESANPWVSRFCVNKGSEPQRLADAARACRRAMVKPAANVCLGTAFLSPAEALADAMAAVHWLHQTQVEQVLLFPMHVKPHTAIGELFRLGLYSAPSLWSLVEVLHRLPPAEQARTNLSWYRLESPASVLASPTSCPSCREAVLTLLDAFRASLDPEWLEKLHRLDCACKQQWRRSLAWPEVPLPERVAAAYEQLARRLRLESLWRRLRDPLMRELVAEFVPIPRLELS